MDTTSPGAGLRVASLIVGGIGLVLAAVGTLVAVYAPPAIAARHAQLVALPSPDAVVLADTPPGREVLIDGRIAADQPMLFRNFVAFLKEEEQRGKSDDDPTEWKVRERQAPPLHIERTGDESIRVVNFAYGLWGAKTSWRDESKVIDTRYTGLVSGEAVVVRGRTAVGGIEAIEVASGTRASYLAEVAGNAGVAWWLGVGFMALGTLMAAIALVLFVKAVRAARKARQPVPWPPEPGAAR
jgi:hypothetical protein